MTREKKNGQGLASVGRLVLSRILAVNYSQKLSFCHRATTHVRVPIHSNLGAYLVTISSSYFSNKSFHSSSQIDASNTFAVIMRSYLKRIRKIWKRKNRRIDFQCVTCHSFSLSF
jgi:hypothetical protein